MSRRKQPALPVPTTDEAAIALISEYIDVERRLRLAAEAADEMIAGVKEGLDEIKAEARPEQEQRFAAIKSWWEAGAAQRWAGKKRSADVAGAKIGTRLSNASVRMPKGIKIDAIVEWLRGHSWTGASRFVRAKYELNKDALIAAWPDEADTRKLFEDKGVKVSQADQFFIDVTPADTKEEARTDG
ncbi:hypothetical protein EAO27_13590 [Sphingopyxis sp. YF1]|uniref:host-nuclease inhibitor Gam family protein n=1 Tax=Sphingopyxis sp. YF1 TaxID=2482763 RepID=UPI001F612519|nr:host-nuclease inhibitor Gam family protein [Sphingopyxis sp. YF1]UNU43641.1 hypothetical protein EAO27_13590 [Sphingopyxis sp. YF1]